MYTIKRERTGRILTTNYDHEVSTLSTLKTREEADKEIASRQRAQSDHYGPRAVFEPAKDGFIVTVDDKDYHVTERFYIEKV